MVAGAEREIYKEEPITKAQEDRFERTIYAEVIAETIASSEGGFNFGISGEWGIGKSSVLKLIEPRLKARNFIVVWFNPWKVAAETVSIRRKFLTDLVTGLKSACLSVELPENLGRPVVRIEQPPLKKRIVATGSLLKSFLYWFGLFGLVPLVVTYFIDWVFRYFGISSPSLFDFYFSILFAPAIAALIPSILSSLRFEQVDPEMETGLQFEQAFKEIVDKASKQRRGKLDLVIFIDDLDRCTSEDMMTIFSGMMSFFERRGITFLIAADQKMVETIVKNKLSDSDKDAREFIKKIFQINWIIPPIPYHLQEKFVKENLPSIIAPESQVKDTQAPNWIVDMVVREFGGNPRRVRYFLRELEFQIRYISTKIMHLEESKEQLNEEELENLRQIREHPELLAKILMIRSADRFANDWESILKQPQLIVRAERGEDLLSEATLNAFIRTKPLFADWDQDPQYYVFISGTTGLEFVELADPTRFVDYTKRGDIEKAKDIVRGASDIVRIRHLDGLNSAIEKTQDPNERLNYARVLTQALPLVEDRQSRSRLTFKFLDTAKRMHSQQPFLHQLQLSELVSVVGGLTDEEDSLAQAKKLLTESPFTNQELVGPILQAFGDSAASLPARILDLYCDHLISVLASNDRNQQNMTMEILISRVKESLARSSLATKLIDNLLILMPQRALSSDPLIFRTLITCSAALNEDHKSRAETHLKSVMVNYPDLVHIVQNLAGYRQIVPKGSVDPVVESVGTRSLEEKEQLLRFLQSSAEILSDNNRETLVQKLLEQSKSQNVDEARRHLNLLKSIVSMFPRNAHTVRKLFGRMLDLVIKGETQIGADTLAAFAEFSDLWISDGRFVRRVERDISALKTVQSLAAQVEQIQNKIVKPVSSEAV